MLSIGFFIGTKQNMSRVSFIGLLSIVAICGPILMWYRLLPTASALPNALSAFTWGILLIIWGVGCYRKKSHMSISLANWAWMVIGFWLVIQTRWVSPPYADTLVFPFAALMLAWALHAMGRNLSPEQRPEAATWLALGFITASYGTVAIQTLQLSGSGWLAGYVLPLPEGMQPFGNLAQRNQAAFVHVLGMLAVAARFSEVAPVKNNLRWFGLAMCLPMIFGLAMTSSRLFLVLGGLVWLAAVFKLGLVWRRNQTDSLPTWVRHLLSGLFFVSLYAVIYSSFAALLPLLAPAVTFDNVVERLGNVSNLTRIVLQHQAWEMFVSRPLTGTGWGSFSAFGLNWSDHSALPLFSDHSHFLPSQWLAELGIVGAILATPLITFVIRILFHANGWRKHFFMQGLIFLTMIYSCSEYPLWEGYFLFPVALVLGVLDAERDNISFDRLGKEHSQARISASWAALTGAVLLAGAVWSGVTYYKLHRLGKQVFTGKPVEASVFYGLNSIPLTFGYSPIVDLYLFVVVPMDREDLSDKLVLGERVAGRFIDSNILLRLSLFYALSGDINRSKRLIQDACRFYPDRCEFILQELGKVTPMNGNKLFESMRTELAEWWHTHPMRQRLPNAIIPKN